MLKFSDPYPHLLNTVDDPLVLNATLGAHGTYTTERFVLRLSPRVHELVDALTRGETATHDEAELVQAVGPVAHAAHSGFHSVLDLQHLVFGLAAFAIGIEEDCGRERMAELRAVPWPTGNAYFP